MIKTRCPKCGVTHPLSEEHKCRAVDKMAKKSDLVAEHPAQPVPTDVAFSATSATDLVPGEPCPTCGKSYGLGSAERQRRYRKRRK